MIPDRVIDDIRDRTDIVEVIGSVLDLKRSGRNYKALCPFHGEKTPSFMVSPEKQIYHCFGCGKGGNVFSFLMEYEGVGFVEAVRKLADDLGVDVSGYTGGQADRSRLDPFYAAMEFARGHFTENLESGEASGVREYLERRGFPQELIESYSLGFASPSWESLYRAAAEAGIDRDVLLEVGLIMRSRGSSGYRDYFRNRVIFPIRNLSGRVVAFAGRVLDGSEPKYINSMESPIYSKSRILYGLDRSKDSIRQAKTAVIVEGYVDHLMLWAKGFTNICAVCGTSLTEDQARLLARYAKRVYIVNDGDRAGIRAAVRAADQLVVQGLEASIVVLPEEEDPDSYVRKEGADALRELVRSAPDYFRYLRGEAEKGPGTASRKTQVVEHLLGTVSRVDQPVRREILLQDMAGLFDIPLDTLRKGLKKGKREKPSESPSEKAIDKTGEVQKEMFRIALEDRELAALVLDTILEEDLEGDEYRRLYRALSAAVESGVDPAGPRFAGSLSDEGLGRLVSEIALMEQPPGPQREVLRDILLWVRKMSLRREMSEMKDRIKELQGTGSDDEKAEEIAIAEAYRKVAKELGRMEIREEPELE